MSLLQPRPKYKAHQKEKPVSKAETGFSLLLTAQSKRTYLSLISIAFSLSFRQRCNLASEKPNLFEFFHFHPVFIWFKIDGWNLLLQPSRQVKVHVGKSLGREITV